jgi:hypothetical protein
MLSLDLFDSKFEKRLHEGAVDDLEQHRIDVLNDRMQELLARAKEFSYKNDHAALAGLKQQYDKIKDERDSYYKVRESQKGQDIVDPKEKMKALTPSKPGVAGAVKDVAKGLKNFLQGRPETGPTYESQKKKLELDHGVIPTEPLPEEKEDPVFRSHRIEVIYPEDSRHGRSHIYHRREPMYLKDIFSDANSVAARNRRAQIDLYVNDEFVPNYEWQDGVDVPAQGIEEHGGGIGPSQRWQDLMPEEELIEGIKDTAGATAVIACLLTGGSLTGCATAPQKTSAQQVLKTGQDLGRTVQTAQRITRAGVEAEVNQEIRNLLRGISGRPEELNHSNILRIWRKINQPKDQPQNEAKQIHTKQDFDQAVASLEKQLSRERDPAVKQMLISQLKVLQDRGRVEGWHSDMLREDNASAAAEQAILKRIMVAHTDLLQQYGPQKVMQAAEEVAYNVGDLGEIGTSDVSGWVKQVKQILGATA